MIRRRTNSRVGRSSATFALRSILPLSLMGLAIMRAVVYDLTIVGGTTKGYGSYPTSVRSSTLARASLESTAAAPPTPKQPSPLSLGGGATSNAETRHLHHHESPTTVQGGAQTGGRRQSNKVTESEQRPRNARNKKRKEEEENEIDVGFAALSTLQNRTVEWLTAPTDFEPGEAYAASWYMKADQFFRVDTGPDGIGNQEAAVFKAINAADKVRMSLDFMDLAVEHMSFWWKMTDAPRHDGAYQFAMNAFTAYINRAVHQRRPFSYRSQGGDTDANDSDTYKPATTSQFLHPTVAVIAFTQNKGWSSPPDMADRAHNFTIAALGASIASLVQIGMGRIVVVGADPSDESVVRDSFRLLTHEAVPKHDVDNAPAMQVHDTQLTFALVPKDMVNSTFSQNNIPRGTLAGLHRAMEGTDSVWTRHWLGDDATYWKYVYYTEADQLLQTRPSMLPHLRKQLDDGYLLNPHRLQPIGYDGDVPGRGLVPVAFKTPITLNSGEIVPRANHPDAAPPPHPYQHCCASPDGEPNRPGRDDFPKCGDWWYLCGFNPGANHSRLEPYDFIKLSEGTGMTTLAATEHARRCIPSTTPCRRGP